MRFSQQCSIRVCTWAVCACPRLRYRVRVGVTSGRPRAQAADRARQVIHNFSAPDHVSVRLGEVMVVCVGCGPQCSYVSRVKCPLPYSATPDLVACPHHIHATHALNRPRPAPASCRSTASGSRRTFPQPPPARARPCRQDRSFQSSWKCTARRHACPDNT